MSQPQHYAQCCYHHGTARTCNDRGKGEIAVHSLLHTGNKNESLSWNNDLGIVHVIPMYMNTVLTLCVTEIERGMECGRTCLLRKVTIVKNGARQDLPVLL